MIYRFILFGSGNIFNKLNGETDPYCLYIDPLLSEGTEESVIVPLPSPHPSPLPVEGPAGNQYQGRFPPGDILPE